MESTAASDNPTHNPTAQSYSFAQPSIYSMYDVYLFVFVLSCFFMILILNDFLFVCLDDFVQTCENSLITFDQAF